MTGITTHVLDTAEGRPAPDVRVELHQARNDAWHRIGVGQTDADGRLRTLLTTPPEAGRYRLQFDTGAYFRRRGTPAFFPEVVITFDVAAGQPHYHVPLLLSPFGYSTYRGS